MKTHTVTIGGREFPLAFTLNTMINLQDEFPDFDFSNINEMLAKPKGIVDIMFQLAASGAALEEKELDISKKWLAERIPANIKSIQRIQEAVIGALTDGMEMETEKAENEDREVDVVLEDIKKKDGKTG